MLTIEAAICRPGHIDNGTESYGYTIVRPIGKFDRRNLLSAPRKFKKYHSCKNVACLCEDSFDEAREAVEKYNRRSRRQGWSTWALLIADQTFAAFLRDVEAAKFPDSTCGDFSPGVSISGSHGWFEEGYCLFASINVHVALEAKAGEDLRDTVLKAFRKQFRRLEQFARSKADPQPGLKVHKPRKEVAA